MDIRTGNGFDVHAFGPGDRVTLCGVAIPFDRGARRPFRRRRRHARPDRRDLRRARRRRHRPVVPALRPGLEGRRLGDLPAQGGGARRRPRLRRHATSTARWSARRRGSARTPRRCAPRSRASPGIDADRVSVKATTSERPRLHRPRRGHRRARHRDAGAGVTRFIATFGYVGLLPVAAGTWGSLAALPLGWLLHWLGGFPAARARDAGALRARLLGDPGRDLRAGTTSTRARS